MKKNGQRASRPRRRSVQGSGYRRYFTEALEQRLVLSGAHDAALLAAIDNALLSSNPSGVAAFTTRLQDSSATGRALPLVGAGFGASYDGGAALKSVLNRLSPTYPSLAALSSGLEGGAGIADGINVAATRDNPDDLELDLHFLTTTPQSVAVAGNYGINLSVSGSVSLSTVLDFQMTVGAYWDAGSSSAVFYVQDTNDALKVSTGVVSTSLNPTGALGVVDLAVTGGSSVLSPAFNFSLIDQGTPGQPGRMTLAQLISVPVPSLVATTVTQAAPSSLTVNFSAALAPTAHTLTVNWADVAKPNTATSTLNTDATLSQLAAFQGILPTTYSSGLDTLAQTISDATTSTLTGSNPFLATLPLLGKSFSDVLNIKQLLTNALLSKTDYVINAQNQQVLTFATAGQLLTLLRAIPGVGAANATMTNTATDIRFTLALPAGATQSLPLSLGIDSQLKLPVTGSMSVTTSTTTNVTFGVNTNNQFFILDTGTPVLTATLSATAALSGASNLGFLGVTITSGTASITGSATLALKDPQTDSPATPGVISTAELVAANLNAMATPTVTGTATASLPLTSSLAALSGVNGTLGVSWADIKQASTFTLNTAAVSQFVGFNNITPAIAISGFSALPAVLSHAGDTTLLGTNLAFLGSSVGGGITLGTSFQTMVNALSTIATAQDLQNTLNAYFGSANVIVSVTASDIEFAVAQTQTIPGSLKWSVNVTEPTSSQGFQSTGTVAATGTYTSNILFGLGFGAALSATDRFYVITGAGSKVGASFKVAATGTVSSPATLGYLPLNIAAGTASVVSAANPANNATISVPFTVPGGGTQLTLTKLQANPPASVLGAPTSDGKVQLTLPITGLPSPGSNPQIGISWANIAQPATVVVTPQNLGDLSPGSNYNAGAATSGLQSVINLINGWSNLPLLNTNLPLVGSPLKSIFNFILKGTSFFQAVINAGDSTPAALDTAVQHAITNAGLDAASVTLTPQPDNNPSTAVFHYLLNFHYNVTGISEPFNFGSSLFTVNGNVTVGVQFNANIEFGLDKNNGFYLVDRSTASSPEVSLTTGVTAALNKIGGNFGPISYGISNGTANVAFNLGLDLVSPQGAGGKIGPGDMSNNIAAVAQPEFLTGSGGTLDLPIGFYLGTGGPGAATEFKANWNPANPGAFYFGTGNSTNPADGFGPVQFELGDFVSGIIGPLIHNIEQYNPLPQKLVDILNYQLPLINQTPAQILGDVTGIPGFALLFQIANVVNQLNSLTGGGTLNLSNYLNSAPNSGTQPSQAGQGGTPAEQSPFQSFLNELENNYGISIPVLQNPTTSIIDILLGQDVKLIEFKPGNNGHVEVSASLTSPQITIPIFSIGFADASVFAQIGGSIGFFANIDLGIDSSGLTGHTIDHSSNLIDGFFIGNQDQFQVGFEGQVFLNLGGQIDIFGFPLVQVYGRLGLQLDLGLHVDDVKYQAPTVPVAPPAGDVEYGQPGGDGRVTFDELNYLIGTYGLACTLELGGALSLFGGIGFRGPDIPFIGNIPDIYQNIGTIPIINFNIPCTPPPPETLANIVGNSLVMVPDSRTVGKHVDVNVYYNAQEQPQGITFVKYDDNGTLNQSFDFATLAADGVTNLVVEGTNGDDVIRIDPMLTSDYNFQHVTVNTRNGNDSVQWGGINQLTSHLLATTITTGDGNDTISGTFVPDSITTGNGNDIVLGLHGNDTISVGNGNDTVQSGTGNDLITTGSGHSQVALGGGNNTVFVGNGGNIISGDNGNNTVHGGSGGDKYYLGDGANSILAGSGNDVIYVGQGANYVSTGAGNDQVFAGDGNNTIFGGAGNDQITAGQGNNNIYGLGNNTIKAGDGKDYVSAGPGNNIITLGNGDSKVIVGNGANFISTGRGQDIVFAGTGPDTVLTGAGDDSISIGAGNDSIDAGAGTNLLQVSGDVNFALSNGAVVTSTGTVSFVNIQRLTLTGGASNNSFDVSAYSLPLPVILDGNGGTDTLVSTDDLNFVLTDGSFSRSDNTAFALKGIARAQLTGGVSDNSFDVGSFTGPVTVEGGSAPADYNRIIATTPGTYTLTNASLTRSTGGTVTLLHINRATLPGGTSIVNSVGFSGLVDLTGGSPPPPTVNGSTDSFGRWTELGQSASNGGVSNSPVSGIEPAIAAAAAGQFVAWADNRGGSYQIYVAQHTTSGWTQLAGSAQGSGISTSAGSARRPAITLDASGNPIVAWTVVNGASTDIQVATYSPTANAGAGGWVALGTSLAAGGISGDGLADNAEIVNTSTGPVVAWIDRSGTANVYVKQFSGGVWSALGTGAASGTGVTASASAIAEFSFATDGTKLAIAWTQPLGGPTQIYLKQYSGGVWAAVNGSASGNGLSNTAGSAAQPSVAFFGGNIFVAYQATIGGQSNAAAVMTSGVTWAPLAIDTPPSAGNAVTRGAASQPQLFQAGGTLELVWLERRLAGTPSQDTEIYATKFNGVSFTRVLPGDASYHGIHWTSASVSALALSVDSAGRPFVAWGDNSSGSPQIYALGATFSIHNVYYVNDALTLDDSYTTASGSAANTGTSASAPLDSVQSVLSKYALSAGDVILVDSGTYSGFTLSGAPSGILIMGSGGVPSTLAGAVSLTNAQGVILQSLSMPAGLTVTSGTNVQLSNLIVSGLTISGGTGSRVEHSSIGSLSLTGGLASAIIVNNIVSGQVALASGGTTNLTMSGNRVTGGMAISAASSGTITNNDISGGGTALNITAAFTGSIDHNAIHNASIGVNYAAAAPLNANRIYSNSTGVTESVNSNTTGLGFVAGSVANDIFFNTTGVNLTGLMQLQHVFSNSTGVTGSGTLGGATLDLANLIEMNTTGVNFTGTIQFNRIARNTIGIQAASGNVVVHNLVYRNVNAGIVTGGTTDVRVWNNTFYATSGNNIQVDGGSSNVQALNNILWTSSGYDIFVADNSRPGFFSDYNDLYSTGAGKIVHWLLDFTDVLDWQVNVNRFDLHSIGTTAVNPTWAQPQFANLSRDDFHVLGLTGALRASSPTLDTGAPMSDVGLPLSYVNLLANPSFESGVTSWTVSVGGATQSANPPPFTGSNYFYSGSVASGFVQQTVNLISSGFTAGNLDNQSLVAVFGGRVRSAAGETPADQGRLIVTFLDGSSNAIGAADTVPATNANDRWELIGDRLHIPAGTRSITYRFEALRQTGSTDDSYLDGAFVYVIPATTAPDQGGYGNTISDIDLATPHVHLVWPDLYTDWELSTPHNIQWSTFGSGGSQVSLDLYQDNAGVPQFLMHIATVPDTGSYSWIPSSPLTYGTYGLRIQASLVSNSSILDRSTETFTIPENGHSFYVNDSSQAGDVYTSAIGSNRNTGKLPGKPKPLLTSLLRAYNLGGADTVNVDTGTYYHFDPVIISGNPAVGGDQGVTITGPSNPANVALINTLGFTSPAVFDINNGNFAILTHLSIIGGDYGIWVRNTSSNFQGSYLTISGATFDGIRLESNSSAGGVLDHLTSFSNGRDGISVGGTGVNLTNSIAHHNAIGAGIRYDNSGGVVFTGNQSYANKWGMLITNTSGNPLATVGNTNLALNLGNIVHDNAVYGIYASGVISVAGNTIYDTAGPGGAGPAQLSAGPAVGQFLSAISTYYYRVTALTPAGETISSPERSSSGGTGTSLSWTAVPGATAYNIYRGGSPSAESLVTTTGGLSYLDTGAVFVGTSFPGLNTAAVYLLGGATATANVVFNSYLGIYSNVGAIANNRVFATAGSGIYASNANATGNVIYSNQVGIEGDTSPTWTNNLIYANGTAGIWLHSGFSANIFNNTIYQQFGDGIRIESSGGNFQFQHVNIRNNIIWVQSGYGITITPQAEIGYQSNYNDLYMTGTAQAGLWENVGRSTLTAWQLSAFNDANSISANPLFVNITGADGQLGFTNFADHGTDDDFHEQSTAGSFHGGALAPIINPNTGLPTPAIATLTSDAVNSPAVDRGDPASSFANETASNGGFINLGEFGNTVQASETFIPYVLVLSPNGGETLVEGQTFTITWRSEVATGTATIDLMNGATVVQNIATAVANNGSYTWTIPNSITPGNYTIRVTRNSAPVSSDVSDALFTLSGPTHAFYVNDATFAAGDFTTAPGSDTNSGLDPAHPMASIRALLNAYNLGAGDIIYVDEGTYLLSSNIVIPANRAGVTIRGFYDAANPTHVTLINRTSTTTGAVTFDVQAINVTLDRLSITGGDIGVNVSDSAGVTGLTVSNSDVYGNYDYNIYLGSTNGGAVITGNKIHDTNGFYEYGIDSVANQVTITNNAIYNNVRYGMVVSNGKNSTISGNTVYNNGTGINADTSTISGNIVYGNVSVGIVSSGNSNVTGNTTYNNLNVNGFPQAGIQASGGIVQGNISYGNKYGIYLSGNTTVSNNRLYGNTLDGIYAGGGSIVSGNVIYQNAVGIEGDTSPQYLNNVIYSNTTAGIWLHSGVVPLITNNTIYQPTGDGIRLESTNGNFQFQHMQLRNNTIWVQAGYDVTATPNSVFGFDSDANDLYVTGSGQVGFWAGVAQSNLGTWQLVTLQDTNSISIDPLFVNAASADFHEQSLYGSFHGGSLAPVLDAGTGLPVPVTATLTSDANQSPVIDRGDPATVYANEPAPNGGFVNIGAYGNTAQASKSPTSYMLVTKPAGGETWIEGQTFNIKWRDHNIGTGLVNIDLMVQTGGAPTLQTNIATGVANSGVFAWTPAGSIPPGSNYLIRVTEQAGPSALSLAPFSIAAATHIYYVNDGTFQAGDWTTAAGTDVNSGIDAAHPKATVAGIFSAYTMHAGDVIMIDAGTYNLTGDIVLTAAQSGITLQGYNNPSFPTRQAVLNRGNASSGTDITLNGALSITVDHLGLTGGLYGFASTYQVVSDNATISNCEIFGNAGYGIYLIGGANNITITNCYVHNDDQGISSFYNSGVTVTNNIVSNVRLNGISVSSTGAATISGNTVTGVSGNGAIAVSGQGILVTVSNNIVHDNGTIGIIVGSSVLATGNTAYNQIGNAAGIQVSAGEARNNVAYNNYYGIYVTGGLADQNRVYNNSSVGIYVSSSGTVSQNQVYSNPTGIQGDGTAVVANNLIYANTIRGIWVTNGTTAQVINNTVYQPAGDAVDILSGENNLQFQHMTVTGNILWAPAGYDLNLSDDSAIGFQSDYNDLFVSGTGKVARLSNRDYPLLSDWLLEYGLDTHSISANPQFVNAAGPDGILGYSGSDHGIDDNFHLQSTSPAIDAGNPTSTYFNEPAPNGSRINLGNFANTPQADPSPSVQSVQVISPSNLQKLEVGKPYTLSWQTAGVVANQPVLLMNTGGPTSGYWSADAFSTLVTNAKPLTNTIDTSGVTNPAPQQVYQSYVYPYSGPELAYQIPVQDGTYTLRLHFMDEVAYIGKPVFNIKVNGVVVRSNFDVFAAAGAAYKATTLTFNNLTASGGTGLFIELVSVSGSPILSAIELSAANASPVSSPTANLQLSTDNGATWTTIATNQPIDSYGHGTYQWTPNVTTNGATALFRVTVNTTALTGTSQPFVISNGGNDYYVNDSSLTGDSLTTAIGNNSNSGKTPDSPLADIQAVLAQYNPGAGAIIHVDNGTYVLVHDLNLLAANSDLIIQGPTTGAAVVNRANTADHAFTFSANASNITIDHLSITGGSAGVYAEYSLNANGNTVSNNQIYGNGVYGVFVGGSDVGWVITSNSIHDNGSGFARGIDIESTQVTITGNTVFNETQAIYASTSASSVISGNELYASSYGIQASSATISNNRVHDNTTAGIYVGGGALVVGNTVYRQTAANAAGILLQSAEARGNAVYGNYNGIVESNYTNTIDRNRVYSNTNFGITATSAAGTIFDNLVYANSAAGIVLSSSSGEVLTDNTVYQLVGDALRFVTSTNAVVRGNILWVEAGYDLNVSLDSQTGFVSNYNDLYRGVGASAHIGFWAGAAQDLVAAWRTASAQDANSISADPAFVSVKGADQVLGYNPVGVGYDGGQDDNFYLASNSPAIDRGYTWGPTTDLLNQPRSDEPGTTNAGSPNYVPAVQASSSYALTGTAQSWRTYGSYFNYTFTGGFTFPFYDATFTSVQVASSGFLQFSGPDAPSSITNSDAALVPDRRIAALWDNISTNQVGNDIYLDTSVSGQVKFTWKATNMADASAVNFSIVLFSDGRIRFDYGAGNANLTPTVGISMGDGVNFTFATYDNAATLTNANSILWNLPPGFTDIGAYEFSGSSADVTPPTVTATTPSIVQSGGSGAPISQIGITFSEPLNLVDAAAGTNYQLVWAGPNGTFGNADDVTYSLTPQYTAGSTLVTLVPTGGGTLPSGLYKLTLSGTIPAGIHDLSGNLLDGDANGTPGGDYVRQFTLGYPALNVINGTPGVDQITLTQDTDHAHVDWTMGSTGGQLLIADAAGLTINGLGASDVITLNYANGNPLPGTLHLNGTFTINGLSGTNPLANTTLEISRSTVYLAYPSPASDPIANVKTYLKNGYNSGAWNGTPTAATGVITSADAAANPLHNTSIGYVDSADGTGLNPVTNTILLKYAVIGDTNLDGTVGLADYTAVVRNFGVGTSWAQGAVTYGTNVGLSDYTAVVRNFGGTIGIPALDVITGTAGVDQITLTQDIDHVHIDWTMGTTTAQLLINDASGLSINGLGSNDVITLNYANGNPLPHALHLNGTFTINGLSGTNPLANTTLEIGKSTVYINYASPGADPIAILKNYLTNGYAAGAWNGTPTPTTGVITSSAAQANPLHNSAIGYADSADGTGINPIANTILLKYAAVGDLNLDGTVGLSDYTTLVRNFGTGTNWDQGAVTYGASVGLADYTAIIRNFGGVTPAAIPALSPAIPAATPSLAPATTSGAKVEASTLQPALPDTVAPRNVRQRRTGRHR